MLNNQHPLKREEAVTWPVDLGTEMAIAARWKRLIQKSRKQFALAKLQHSIDKHLEPALQVALDLSYTNDAEPLAMIVCKGHAIALRYEEGLSEWLVHGPGQEVTCFDDEHMRVYLLAYLHDVQPVSGGALS